MYVRKQPVKIFFFITFQSLQSWLRARSPKAAVKKRAGVSRGHSFL